MHQSIDRERGFLGRLSRGGLVCPFQLSLQLEPAHLQHLGGAIQNLPTQISALLRPSAKGRSSRDNGISKIFAGSAAIIGNQRAAGSARWKAATVFAAHKLAADVQFVGVLNLELPLRLCHESRIAQRGEKENAKPQQSIS